MSTTGEHLALKRILFPTDLTPASLAVFPYAADLARLGGGEIRVLFLVDQTEAGLNQPLPLTSAKVLTEGLLRQGRKELDEKAAAFEAEGVSVETAVKVTDSIPEAIREDAVLREMDLIVIGTHGRTGFTRLLCGSVAEAVIRRAPCPVMAVRVV